MPDILKISVICNVKIFQPEPEEEEEESKPIDLSWPATTRQSNSIKLTNQITPT
jgi:hypothetical protein